MKQLQSLTNIWMMLYRSSEICPYCSLVRNRCSKKGVHNYLKRQKHVESFRLGEFGEGDAGVTIVEFKK